jgi:PilZ domain-containing protein
MHLRRESSTLQPGQERRTMRRFDMRLPASVRVAGNGINGLLTETQNVSARGVFFYLDRPLAEGARIEVTMTFPPHVTLTDPVRVRFTARVVRIENLQALSGVGVAAMIEEYEFLRSNPSAEIAGDDRFGT